MILPVSFTARYEEFRPLLERTAEYVESRLVAELGPIVPFPPQVRVKSPESCYSKLAKGDFEGLTALEDLVGARVTVLHPVFIESAAQATEESFRVIEKKNNDSPNPDDFRYRQLHFIVKLPADYVKRNPELDAIKVEIQFTTYLQLALQETVHAVVYKAGEFSWLRSRTAGQMRGALELLDSLLEALRESPDTVVEPDYPLFDQRNEIVGLARDLFSESELPSDLRRFAITIETFMQRARVDLDELRTALTGQEDLMSARSLTPTEKILGALLRNRGTDFVTRLNAGGRRYLVSSELESLCPEAAEIDDTVRVVLDVPEQ